MDNPESKDRSRQPIELGPEIVAAIERGRQEIAAGQCRTNETVEQLEEDLRHICPASDE